MRSIPACAGEPTRPARTWPGYAVYPRVCGGTPPLRYQGESADGLSPRVRGNRSGTGSGETRRGSIPACAGEPHLDTYRCPASRVYPRVCGGTGSPNGATMMATGLSPRVRGNRSPSPALRCGSGSIPACAGEPGSNWDRPTCTAVYPRVCGGTPVARCVAR